MLEFQDKYQKKLLLIVLERNFVGMPTAQAISFYSRVKEMKRILFNTL
jgi:hypothetical protein